MKKKALECRELRRDLIFELSYDTGLIWLVNRIFFLELNAWAKKRLTIKETVDA